jgi:ferritin
MTKFEKVLEMEWRIYNNLLKIVDEKVKSNDVQKIDLLNGVLKDIKSSIRETNSIINRQNFPESYRRTQEEIKKRDKKLKSFYR